MNIKVQVNIQGPKEKVWHIITDIEKASKTISGIEKIEILNQPESGLVGLKWRETRTLFGKTATEDMWITDVIDHQSYKTRAESHGAIYMSSLTISEQNNETLLNMEFSSEAQTFAAKIMSVLMGSLFKSATKKVLLQDLNDIKAAVERKDV